jgi:hypothetical protein
MGPMSQMTLLSVNYLTLPISNMTDKDQEHLIKTDLDTETDVWIHIHVTIHILNLNI